MNLIQRYILCSVFFIGKSDAFRAGALLLLQGRRRWVCTSIFSIGKSVAPFWGKCFYSGRGRLGQVCNDVFGILEGVWSFPSTFTWMVPASGQRECGPCIHVWEYSHLRYTGMLPAARRHDSYHQQFPCILLVCDDHCVDLLSDSLTLQAIEPPCCSCYCSQQ